MRALQGKIDELDVQYVGEGKTHVFLTGNSRSCYRVNIDVYPSRDEAVLSARAAIQVRRDSLNRSLARLDLLEIE